MDTWSPEQVQYMRFGGNGKLNDFLQARGVPKSTPIRQKYNSKAAELYREVLRARAEGRSTPQRDLASEEMGPAPEQQQAPPPQRTRQSAEEANKQPTSPAQQLSAYAEQAAAMAREGVKESGERLTAFGAEAARRTTEYAEHGWRSFQSLINSFGQSQSRSDAPPSRSSGR